MRSQTKPLLLRNRSFTLLWLGQVLSQSGSRMFHIAVAWWFLKQHTENVGTLIGLFMVATALPAVMFVKPIAHIISRFSYRRVIGISEVLAALFSVYLIYRLDTGSADHLTFIGVAFMLAINQAFVNPTISKAIPEVVDFDDITPAVALQTSTMSVANFGGAVAGAALIEQFGITGVTVLNGLSYVGSALLLLGIRQRPPLTHAQPNEVTPAEPAPASSKHRLRSLWKIYPLQSLILLMFGVFNFFAIPTLLVIPIYVEKILGQNASYLSVSEAVLWGGLMLGTWLLGGTGRIRATVYHGPLFLLFFGLFLALPGFLPHVWLFPAFLAIAGVFLGMNNVLFGDYFLKSIAIPHHPSFFSLQYALISFTWPIGFLVSGVSSDLFAASDMLIFQGMGVVGVALYMSFLVRRISTSQGFRPVRSASVSA